MIIETLSYSESFGKQFEAEDGMMMEVATINDVQQAEPVIHRFISPAPLIRSYRLEQELGLNSCQRVWIKDYGWTPVGSFKLMGALYWMHNQQKLIGERPVAAHSSGNFASGISFAGQQFNKRVIVVMPSDAPQVKFALTKSFGAEVRTYNKATDHLTGERDRMTKEISEQENAEQASPYDHNDVIAGNGVGGLEIVEELQRLGRELEHFVCPVSGGGLMAGHALAIAHGFPRAAIWGVEPDQADDFQRSLQAGERVRLDQPHSICDGLLSYDVGHCNWPILQQHVRDSLLVSDEQTISAMRWLYENHGLVTEPSGAIPIAAGLSGNVDLTGEGDVVFVLSGRNVDRDQFASWIGL